MIAVIADDITGAAEIAGIGLRFGLRVRLSTNVVTPPADNCDLLVCATNTRSFSKEEAATESTRLGDLLHASGCTAVFKKTDSVLRGHVVSELRALMKSLNLRRALLLPQNPSRGRVIREGMYYVDDVALDCTPFRHDPEFPAFTSDVVALLRCQVCMLSPGERAGGDGIFIGNATSTGEIASYLPLITREVLAAGGADFFAEWLSRQVACTSVESSFHGIDEADVLIVCGSTARHSLHESAYINSRGIPVCNMPEEVFEGASPDAWIVRLRELYAQHHSMLLHIDHAPRQGNEFAARLRSVMAGAVTSLFDVHIPHELIIEGGATAFAILQMLGWTDFVVENEVSSGVIRMAPHGTSSVHVTMKPGSYPWGERLFN